MNKGNDKKERFLNVLNYLKSKGISQSDIAEKVYSKKNWDFNSSRISEIKSGKQKTIPNELKEILVEEYNINEEYLNCKSDIMINEFPEKFSNFLDFVENWDIVQRKGKDEYSNKIYNDFYLYLTLNKNFIDFIIENKKLNKDNLNEFLDDEELKEKLKNCFNKKIKKEKYVLLPAKIIHKIVKENNDMIIQLSDVFDSTLYNNLDDDFKKKMKAAAKIKKIWAKK